MKRFFLFLSLFLLSSVLHADKRLEVPALVLQLLNHCYDKESKTGPDLAKCVLAKLKNKKNPDGYRVNFTQDSFDRSIPSNFTLIIYNKEGLIFNCRGIAGDKIHMQSCTSEQVEPLGAGKELSITPPN